MIIIEDTAQKNDKHEIKHSRFEELGVELIRNKLPFGDYCLPPYISVDTKADMDEIAMDIGSDHTRFRNECIKAKNAGCQLIILVENTQGIRCVDDVSKWINPRLVYSPNAISGERLMKAMKSMSRKYSVEFVFCHPEESADYVVKLLGGWQPWKII